jgi:molybdate transport system ATP-binding protein
MKLRCRIPLASFELDVDASFDSRVAVIFGPSGAGKTTLLDAIAGLRRIAEGEIEIGGTVLFSSTRGIDLPARQRSVGYVPQEGALFPHFSVRKNILFGARRNAGLERSKAFSLEHVVEVLEIGHLLERSVKTLSGGEAQRAALARAILSQPRLLLLDEPLAALDIGLKERILPYLARVRDDFAIPMIYVTHNLAELLTLADWVLMIQHGRLVAHGPPKEIFHSRQASVPLTGEPIENVFAATFLESEKESGRSLVRLPSGTELFVPYRVKAPGTPVSIAIKGDDILIATTRPEGISAANVLPGTIGAIDFLQGEALITAHVREDFFARLTAGAAARLRLTPGSQVYLVMKTRSFEVF